ncbi:hypothetical protein C8J56DRAFT_887949 [Mycena floridula]|nr:hypothetical protein C8J56DRAFT_887949 [Mycena floridula]
MANVELSLGPMLIGVYLNLILFGGSDFDYAALPKVSYLFIMETTNSVCDMAMMYQPLIAEWGTDKAITFFPTLFLMQPIVLVEACVLEHGSVILKLYVDKPQLNSTALIWFGCSCVSDIFIAILLVRSLSTRKTGFVATDSVVDKLVRTSSHNIFKQNLGSYQSSAVSAVGEIIFFMVSPVGFPPDQLASVAHRLWQHTSLNFVWDLALSKIYSNCLLSSLNARTAFKHTLAGTAERNIVFAERISYLPPSYELETGLTFQSKDEPYIARDARYNGIKITQITSPLVESQTVFPV